MNSQSRLKTAFKEAGIKPSELAKLMNTDPQNVNNWKNRGVPYDKAFEIGAILQVAPEWLVCKTEDKTPKNYLKDAKNGYIFKLLQQPSPLTIGQARLHDDGRWDTLEPALDGNARLPTEGEYAIQCLGDGMKPRVKNLECIIINPASGYVPGDEVLVEGKDGKIMLKIYLYERDGSICLLPVNERYPSFSISPNEINSISPVSAIATSARREREPRLPAAA